MAKASRSLTWLSLKIRLAQEMETPTALVTLLKNAKTKAVRPKEVALPDLESVVYSIKDVELDLTSITPISSHLDNRRVIVV